MNQTQLTETTETESKRPYCVCGKLGTPECGYCPECMKNEWIPVLKANGVDTWWEEVVVMYYEMIDNGEVPQPSEPTADYLKEIEECVNRIDAEIDKYIQEGEKTKAEKYR